MKLGLHARDQQNLAGQILNKADSVVGFARLAGISPGAVHGALRGDLLRARTAKKIASALDAKLLNVFEWRK